MADLELIEAAKRNDLDGVKKAIADGGNASFQFSADGTWGACKKYAAIHFAIQHNNIEMVAILLQNGAKTDAVDADYDWRGCGRTTTAFEEVATKNNDEMLELFLKHGADANLASHSDVHSMRTDGSHQWTLLITATKNNSLRSVTALLNAGANVTAEEVEVYHNERGYNSNNRRNSLHIACDNGSLPLVKLILEAKNGLSLLNSYREYTLHEERKEGKKAETDDPRSAGYISPVVCVQVNETALHIAIKAKNQELFEYLVAAGANMDLNYKYGNKEITTASLAAENGMSLFADMKNAAKPS